MTSSTPSSPRDSDAGQADGPGPGDRREAAADAAAATIADLRARVGVLENEWRRCLADADNMRKRFAAEAGRIRDRERAEAARRWLPVIDDLDRALEHAGADPGSIVQGIRAIRDEAVRVLADLGFPRRDDTGEAFDPARHDAVGSRPAGEAPPGTVLQVVRPAYGSGEQQLRPALVVVAKDS
jgi:molecular chaperone GrpE